MTVSELFRFLAEPTELPPAVTLKFTILMISRAYASVFGKNDVNDNPEQSKNIPMVNFPNFSIFLVYKTNLI